MELGFCLPFAGSWATPDNQVTVARRAEELGYSSLWGVQRLLYPIEPRNDYPSTPGQPWPAAFEQVVDPIVTLAHVAGVTGRIRLGTATLIAVYVPPVVLAKQLATLDLVCDGRLDVGLSLGWSQDEYEACGVPFKERGARLDEYLRCLHALWGDDPVEFSGRFYSVPRSLFLPKPRQRPRPPILDRRVRRGDRAAGGDAGRRLPRRQRPPGPHHAAGGGAAFGRGRRRSGAGLLPDRVPRRRPPSRRTDRRATTAARCGARSTRSAPTSPATATPASTSCSSN